jgi:hypothetical protein
MRKTRTITLFTINKIWEIVSSKLVKLDDMKAASQHEYDDMSV